MLWRFPGMRALLKAAPAGVDDLGVPGDETIVRPRGSASFLTRIERRTGRCLAPAKRGPKPREDN